MTAVGKTARLLPADEDTAPSNWDRIRFVTYVIVPWLALYALTSKVASHGTKFGMAFEDHLPIIGWTALVYQSIYVVILLAPWWVRTRRDLRRLMVSSWIAMAVIFPFYWLVPSNAPRRPLLGHDWISNVLGLERTMFPPIAAFPSFHVVWAVLLARASRHRMGWSYVVVIALSCITTGQHYIADVLSAMVIAPAFVYPAHIWKLCAWFADSKLECCKRFGVPIPEDTVEISKQTGVVPLVLGRKSPRSERAEVPLAKAAN